jgi:arginine/ornithine transport system substrate-binding protein
MRKLIAAIVVAAVAAGGYVWYSRNIEAPRTLRVAVEGADPPFNYIDKDGNLAGFDVDIADALCAHLGMRCELVQQDWNGMVPGLLLGKYDAIVSSMAITAARKHVMNFAGPYYGSIPARFIARKGLAVEATPQGLADKRVGVQRATIQEKLLRAHFPEVVLALYDNQAAEDADLAAGNIDLAFDDQLSLASGFLKSDAGKDFALVGPPVTDPAITGTGAGIALRQEDGDLLVALNRALAAVRADGTYKKLNDKYFDFDIGG